jgi:hypothetical protein
MVKAFILANLLYAVAVVLHTFNICRFSDHGVQVAIVVPMLYYSYDMVYCSWDYKLHHMAYIFLLFGIKTNFGAPFETKLLDLFGTMEVSTIFLDLLILFPESVLLQILFTVTFIYTRVVNMFLFFTHHGCALEETSNLSMTFLTVIFFLQMYWTKDHWERFVVFLQQ